MLFLFLAVYRYVEIAAASSVCGPNKAISLAIKDVTLPNKTFTRGIPLAFGTPPQTLALLPFWPYNDTWVYDEGLGDCLDRDNQGRAYCTTYHGNFFDKGSSKSFASSERDSIARGEPVNNFEQAQDTLTLTPTVSLKGFNFGISADDIGGDYHQLNAIGLGRGSSLLAALIEQDRILSKTWSFFWGLAGATSPAARDGSFTLGGYDSTLAVGNNHTTKLKPPTDDCPTGMQVTVTNLGLKFPNGTQTSLMPQGDSGFLACIVPDWPMAMNIRYDPYYKTFEDTTQSYYIDRSIGLNFWGSVYNTTNVFQGDLAIGLDNGMTSAVLNSQLVMRDERIDPDSGAFISNNTSTEVLILSLQDVNANDMPKIGRPFFSGAYLMVDYDAGEFTLWSIPTEQQTSKSTKQRLVSIGDACARQDDKPAVVTPEPEGTSKVLSTGAIAGIVVGSLLVAAIFIAGMAVRWKMRGPGSEAYVQHKLRAATKRTIISRPASLPSEPQEIEGTEKAAPPAYSAPGPGNNQRIPRSLSGPRSVYEMPGDSTLRTQGQVSSQQRFI